MANVITDSAATWDAENNTTDMVLNELFDEGRVNEIYGAFRAINDVAQGVTQWPQVDILGTFECDGAATLNSTIAVTGTSTLTGDVTTIADLNVGVDLDVAGDAQVDGTLDVVGVATFDDDIRVSTGYLTYNSGQNQWFCRNAADSAAAQLTTATHTISGSTNRIHTPRIAFAGFSNLDSSDFSTPSSSGWGAGSSVSTVDGGDTCFTFTITAAGTPSANPTITITFTSSFPYSPIAVTTRAGGAQLGVGFSVVSSSTTTLVLQFDGTPVAAETLSCNVFCPSVS